MPRMTAPREDHGPLTPALVPAPSPGLLLLRRAGILVGVALLVAVGPRAARADAPTVRVPSERYVLRNGLTVILHEDHSVPEVAVNVWFRVGSKDEKKGRTGFAHLFEHLMFMGTRRVPNGRFDEIMEAAGGQNNASTSEDRTNYFETGPSNLLPTFLYLEADRLSTLADDMSTAKVDLQRDVVKNERRQSYENRPYGRVELALPEHLFPEGHPYHHPVIGSHEDLTAATAADVKDFFHTYYVPSNAQLVIAGDFQPAEARRLVEKYFGAMETRPSPPHAEPEAAKLLRSETIVQTDRVELPRVVLAWHSPREFSDGDAEAELLASVLGGGKSSRLYRALVYEQKIAQAVEVEQHGLRGDGMFVVTVTAQTGHTAGELERAVEAELGRLRASVPVSEAELTRARANVETQLLREAERLATRADLLNAFEYYLGDPGAIETQLLGRYEAVTPAAVKSRAEQILSAPRLSVHVEPEPAAGAPKPAAATTGGAK